MSVRRAGPLAPVLAATVALATVAAGTLAPAAAQEGGPVVTSLTLFAGTATGLWRSTNWGGRWERVLGNSSNGITLADVGPVHGVLPVGRQVYLAAETGLFQSEDFGVTWKKLGLETPVLYVLPSRYPNADPTVFAGTAAGLLKSTDAGRTFFPTVLRSAVTRIEWPGPALIVTTTHGVLVSMDGGGSFSSGTGLPDGSPEALAVSSFFVRDPVLFAGVGGAGVFRSADGAATWSPAGLEGRAVRDLVWLGPILYAATDRGLFRSDDAGKKWDPVAGLAGRPSSRIIFPLAPDSGLEAFLVTEDGIVHTADGGAHWKAVGAPEDPVLCLATFPPLEHPRKK
jgi:hypothetical protein